MNQSKIDPFGSQFIGPHSMTTKFCIHGFIQIKNRASIVSDQNKKRSLAHAQFLVRWFLEKIHLAPNSTI